MTSSLVGSEMCIRDRYLNMTRIHVDQPIEPEKVERPEAEPCWTPTDTLQAAFPTASRMRDKAKEAAVKLETGEK
eukprot:9349061-Prorocentrum_lima.AAC.1